MSGKRVAIIQSNYVPWKGYFDLINAVDEFVLLDDAQYTKRDWRNRNRIKTPQGTAWLTIPVLVKGRYHQRICDTVTSGSDWAAAHWRALELNYARASYFATYAEGVRALYDLPPTELSEINERFLRALCEWLGIATPLAQSRDYAVAGTKGERILGLCLAAGADEYVSGPAARTYLDEAMFTDAGVRVLFADYGGYAEYPQVHPPFEHAVSALDLLFNVGPEARAYLKTAVDRDAILSMDAV